LFQFKLTYLPKNANLVIFFSIARAYFCSGGSDRRAINANQLRT